jgi:hypothetical protein
MKQFFIVDVTDSGMGIFPLGFMTNNLHRDFIERYEITFDQEGGSFEKPTISNVEVGKTERAVYIFDMMDISTSPGIDRPNMIGNFDFYCSRQDYEDEVADFLMDYWDYIELNIDESNSVKKFKDFN